MATRSSELPRFLHATYSPAMPVRGTFMSATLVGITT